jgi:chromosomal replication initiator protein
MVTWQAARERLRGAVGEAEFQRWLKPLRAGETGDGRVSLEAPSKFFRDWIARNYLEQIRRSFCEKGETPPVVVLGIEPSRQKELFAAPLASKSPPSVHPGASPTADLISDYTFENFVVGPSNQLAHATSLAVANRLGTLYNPLFLYGAVGVGKTHLANAIGHHVLLRNPRARVVYLPSETFVNDLITCLRSDRMGDFKNRLRKVDLLILDDAQFLAGRERTQEEFFHTFNSLHEKRRQIVLTSDDSPKDIPKLEQRLRNRFEWGLVADIQTPDVETRAAITQKKAEMAGLSVSPEIADFIAREAGNDVRKLEGAVSRLVATVSLRGGEITLPFARDALKDLLRTRNRDLTIEQIQLVVSRHYGISLEEMLSKRRTQQVAPARQVAMYLARKLTHLSFPVIGTKFGGRHHSTVIHAQDAVERRLGTDPGLCVTMEALETTLLQD